MNPLYKTLTIASIRQETPDTKTFVFRQQENDPVVYHPGQYLTLVHQAEAPEIRRPYSIISSPALREPLAITVKRVENGIFSRRLVNYAKPGDQLLTTGAAGFFVLPPDLSHIQQIFFLAAGSGIAPVYSLLKTVLYRHPHIHVILIYSNQTPELTIFKEELRQLAGKFPGRFHIEFLFSNTQNLQRARLNREKLIAMVDQYRTAYLSGTLGYICGPHSYMRMCSYGLLEARIPAENIKRENFNTEPVPAVKPEPPDKETHVAKILVGNNEYNVAVQYPDTILQAARKHGLTLPYSCEVGRCGSCAAQCEEGKVWMSYNEVLTRNDLQKGLTLTCVGYPVGGDVVLRIE